MTIFQGTLLNDIISDILTRKGFCPLPSQGLVDRINILQSVLPREEVDHILTVSYKVIGFNPQG